nr:MAG TPA: hypothetical protein [Caudoviricetes sp.]
MKSIKILENSVFSRILILFKGIAGKLQKLSKHMHN